MTLVVLKEKFLKSGQYRIKSNDSIKEKLLNTKNKATLFVFISFKNKIIDLKEIRTNVNKEVHKKDNLLGRFIDILIRCLPQKIKKKITIKEIKPLTKETVKEYIEKTISQNYNKEDIDSFEYLIFLIPRLNYLSENIRSFIYEKQKVKHYLNNTFLNTKKYIDNKFQYIAME